MVDESKGEDVAAAMRHINRAWLEGRVDDLAPLVNDEIVMVGPGFDEKTQGREPFLAGFRDFCDNSTIQEFSEHDQQVDLVGDTAVLTFRYEMVYKRSGGRYRSTGRDFRVFHREGTAWVAAWRTMFDAKEDSA